MKNTKKKKIRKMTHKMQANLLLVFCVIVIFFIILIGRLLYINNKDGERYAKRVLSQQTYVSKVIPYKRGDIVDRKGTVLATSEKVYNLVLDPKYIRTDEEYEEATIKAISSCFDIEKDEILEILSNKPESRYVILRKELSYEKVEQFKELEDEKNSKIRGVWFEEEYIRRYPNDTLASHIIGFTSKGNVGNWGIEEFYNSELNGTNGREYGYFDSELKLERNVKEAVNGNTIVTTIDANIQGIVQKHINTFQKEIGSKNTGVIVMNPNNGEIYAMASNYEYNLNDPWSLEGFYKKSEIKKMTEKESLEALNGIWRNFMISDTFEPGSTFKPMTLAAGFEEGILTGNETYLCDGHEVVSGSRIACSKTHGLITLKQVISLSCNDALMQIGAKETKKIFTKWQKLFGFGLKSGIDLPGEASGLLYSEDKMGPVELATNSFGQTFTVNMVQLASAYCSVVNGGYYYVPHVVKQVRNQYGAPIETFDAQLVKETTSKKTSEKLNEYLLATVDEGTATGAQVKGYQIGGKTGTAEKLPRNNGKYLVSFIGSVPANKPEVVIYVVVDEPDVENQAQSSLTTKLTSKILKDILPFLEIYPVESDEENSKTKEEQSATELNDTLNDTNEKNEEITNE